LRSIVTVKKVSQWQIKKIFVFAIIWAVMKKLLPTAICLLIFATLSFAQTDFIRLKHKLKFNDKPIHAVFLPNSKKVLVLTKNSTQVWSTETGSLELTFPQKIEIKDSFDFRLQPNGTKIVTFNWMEGAFSLFGKKSSAYLWDTNTGKLIATLSGENESIRNVFWSENGNRIVTLNSGDGFTRNEVSVWNENGKLINRIYKKRQYDAGIKNIRFIDDGKKLLFDQGFKRDEKPIVIWDIEKQQIEKSFDQNFNKSDGAVASVFTDISPDEKLICGSYGMIYEDVLCWETNGDESVKFLFRRTKEEGSNVFCGFSHDGSRFAILKTRQNIIHIIDSQSGKILSEIKSDKDFGYYNPSIARSKTNWSPDDRYFITFRKDKFLDVWRTENGKFVSQIKLDVKRNFLEDDDYGDTRFHPFKPIIAMTSEFDSSPYTRFFDLETGKLIASIPERAIFSFSIQEFRSFLSSDGSMFITRAKEKNTLNIWEIK
jgi:WD40 repeat protein